MPGYYFPLIIGIILAEAVILVLILLDILPIHAFEVYPFAQYAQYVSASDVTRLSVTITRWFFFLLTAGVLLPTTLIIMLEITRRVLIARKGEVNAWDDEFTWLDKLDKKKPEVPADAAARVQGDYITRFDIHQRIQHFVLMGSFIILAVTGFLRGFPNWPTFHWFTQIFGGTDMLRLVHDIAAFIMVADGIYHLGYIGYGYFVKHKSPSAMFPSLKDLKDIIHTSLWIFGMHKHEPEYDHFQYGQKIDYWAIFWGMPVMVITGVIMMFSVVFQPVARRPVVRGGGHRPPRRSGTGRWIYSHRAHVLRPPSDHRLPREYRDVYRQNVKVKIQAVVRPGICPDNRRKRTKE